jgi:hypothetical protein
MALSAAVEAARGDAAASGWSGRAVGRDLEGRFTAPGLATGSHAGSRPTRILLADETALDGSWDARDAAPVMAAEPKDGRSQLKLDEHPRLGFRWYGDEFGVYRVSADGSTVWAAPRERTPWRWQRFLIGQVLPLVAVLRGLEVFHASAVASCGRVAAFVGDSGAGKSSVAAHLVLRGASFVTDDVLAVEAGSGELVAHPGPGVLSLRHPDDGHALAQLGTALGRDEEAARIELPREERALPLAAMYFLSNDRRSRTEIGKVDPPDWRMLLFAGFNFVVRPPARLARQLDVYARIAAATAMHSVFPGEGATASELAAAVDRHIRAEGCR